VSRRASASAVLGVLLLVGAVAAPCLADEVHVVRPGETLWQIAAALSGNPNRWPELYRANRDQIKDPSLLYPGQRLAIPEGVRSSDRAGSESPPSEEKD
jgi:nucleoid-associated protein YgaU